jgi:hypothetical protein
MKTQPLLAIVRGERIDNVSAKGGRSYARVRGLLHYVAYGRHAEQLGHEAQPRGTWLDQAGRPHTHEAVRDWARAKVHQFEYNHAYQLLLSTRDGDLPAEAFNQALTQGSDISQVHEWRFMVHDDTDHQHAHTILFSHEKLTSSRYREWQQAMQLELVQLQSQRQAALTPELEQAAEAAREQARTREWRLGYE